MKTLIIKYASYRYKKIKNKYEKICSKEHTKGYSHSLNIKRMKAFKKLINFKEKWEGCIHEI